MKRFILLSFVLLSVGFLTAGNSDPSVTKEAPTYQVSQEFDVNHVQVYTPVYASTSVDVMHSEVLTLIAPELGSPVAKFDRVSERSVKGYLVTNKAPPRYRC